MIHLVAHRYQSLPCRSKRLAPSRARPIENRLLCGPYCSLAHSRYLSTFIKLQSKFLSTSRSGPKMSWMAYIMNTGSKKMLHKASLEFLRSTTRLFGMDGQSFRATPKFLTLVMRFGPLLCPRFFADVPRCSWRHRVPGLHGSYCSDATIAYYHCLPRNHLLTVHRHQIDIDKSNDLVASPAAVTVMGCAQLRQAAKRKRRRLQPTIKGGTPVSIWVSTYQDKERFRPD
jgi:hypothetical protein